MHNRVQIIISLKELAVIRKIRKMNHGVVRVTMRNGTIEYIATEQNEKIEDASEIDGIDETGSNAIIDDTSKVHLPTIDLSFTSSLQSDKK